MSAQPLLVYGELIPAGAIVVCDSVEHAVAACWPTYDPEASPSERFAARRRITDELAAEMRVDAIVEAELDPVARWRLRDQPVAVQRLFVRPAGQHPITGLPAAYGVVQPRLVLAAHLVVRLPEELPDNVLLVDGKTSEELLIAAIRLNLIKVESLGRKVRS